MQARYRIVSLLILHALLLSTSGCYCHFRAFKATAEGEFNRFSDADEVALSLTAPGSIPIYWDGGEGMWCGDGPPERTYEVVGVVSGAAAFIWQTHGVIDSNLRRAAHALRGDAVVDARRGVFTGAYPANEFHGVVVRWRDDGTTVDSSPVRGFRFDSDSGFRLDDPSIDDLNRALARLNGVDESFATLTADEGSFIQAGGGPAAFTVDTRKVTAREYYRLLKATLYGGDRSERHLRVRGASVTVRAEQVLDLPSVQRLFRAFLRNKRTDGIVAWEESSGPIRER